LVLAAATSCDRSTPDSRSSERAAALVPLDTPVPDWARQQIAELVETLQPIDLTLTSNHHDVQYWREKALIERLERGEQELGWAALHAFTNFKERDAKIRRSLLRIGARTAPDQARQLLEFLTFAYGPYIEDRTEACLLFAEIAPARYMELARPFVVRRGVLRETLPEDQFLVKGWIIACKAAGISPVEVMCNVATNLMMDPYARVLALRTLAAHELTPASRGVLQTCLVESMGDGYLRRVAAQGIIAGFPREDACALLRNVLLREADPSMAEFLDQMLQEYCR